MLDPFRLVISTPLPSGQRFTWIDISPEVTALQWSTGVGGHLALNVGIHLDGQPVTARTLENAIMVPDLAHVALYAGSEKGFLCFQGRAQDIDDNLGQKTLTITAAGYGTAQGALGDQWFWLPDAPTTTTTSTSGTSSGSTAPKGPDDTPTTAGNLLRRMMRSVTSIIRPGDDEQFTDPGGQFTPREQANRYLGQAVDQFLKTGADGGVEFTFAVWEGLRAEVRPLIPPRDASGNFLPDYRVRLDQRVQLKRSMGRLIGACAVQYTPQGGKASSTGLAEIPGWAEAHGGLMRQQLIPNSTMTRAQANAQRDRYLRRYSVPVRTGPITLTEDNPFENAYGQPVPYYVPRYGQWIEIGGEPFTITQTSTDASSKKTTVTVMNVPQ